MVESSSTAMMGQTQICRLRNEPVLEIVLLIVREAQVMWALWGVPWEPRDELFFEKRERNISGNTEANQDEARNEPASLYSPSRVDCLGGRIFGVSDVFFSLKQPFVACGKKRLVPGPAPKIGKATQGE